MQVAGQVVDLTLNGRLVEDFAKTLTRALIAFVAAMLIGQKKYSAGIRVLQAIVHAHSPLAAVHHQLGAQLLRMGRLDEAIQAFDTVRELRQRIEARPTIQS